MFFIRPELPERDADRCILVRGCKPEFVLLCDAEELLHPPELAVLEARSDRMAVRAQLKQHPNI